MYCIVYCRYCVYILYVVQFQFTHRKISVSVYVALYSFDRFWAMVNRCSHLEYPLKTVAAWASIVWFLALDAILGWLSFFQRLLFTCFSRWGGVFGFWLLWLLSCCRAVLVAVVVVIVEILVAALVCVCCCCCIYLWSSLVAVGNFHTAAHSTVSHDWPSSTDRGWNLQLPA